MVTDIWNIGVRKDFIGLPTKILIFEQIFQTMACIVLVLDVKGHIDFINDNGSRLLEYDTGELIGENWFYTCLGGSVREDRQGYFDKVIQRFSETAQSANRIQRRDKNPNVMTTPISHENAVVTKNGNTRIILWRNHPFYNTDGTFEGLLCMGEDITTYRETEKSLQISLSKHRALFECFPLGISVTDEEGQILENNRLAEKLLSVVRLEHDVQHFGTENWKVLRPDGSDMPPDEYPSVQSLSTGRPIHNIEMGIINSDFSTTWVSASAAPMDQEGYGVVVTYNDITERKRLEDLLVARERLREFAALHDLEELIQFLLDQAKKLTQSQNGYIYFLETTNDSLGIQAYIDNLLNNPLNDPLDARSHEAQAQVMHEGGIADCVRSGKPMIQNDAWVVEHEGVTPDAKGSMKRQMLIPVMKGDRVTAVITLANKPMWYTEHDVEAVIQLSSLVWDIIGRKQAELALEEINLKLQEALAREQKLANTDELTGLNNRRHILEIATHEIMMAKRYRQPLSVLMFDLDHLKWVNDTYGHSEGDSVIRKIAGVAVEELRACDAIGRLGGDEFIVLLPMAHVEQARRVAERIRTKVLACVSSEKSKADKISISVGISEYIPCENDGMTADALFCQADRAMYYAKSQGRNVVVVNEGFENR